MSLFASQMGTPTTSMSPAEFIRQRDPEAPIIDVRSSQEFAEGHLDGAINANAMAPDFAKVIGGLELPKAGPVYLYCRSGNRSKMATGQLQSLGYIGAVNIGGFDALVAAGAKAA